MLRTTIALLGLALLAPANVSAAPLREVPFLPMTGGTICLRATGAPGELVRGSTESMQFVQASATGLTEGDVFPLQTGGCPGVASAPNGAGVLVALSRDETLRGEVSARLREPGQSWGAPAVLAAADIYGFDVGTAVSERGDAVVAMGMTTKPRRASVIVRRRAPGGGFGAAETLRSIRTNVQHAPTVRAGVSATGEAIVAWSMLGEGEFIKRDLWVALAAPGAPFGTPVRVARLDTPSSFEFAMARDGRALLTYQVDGRLLVAEREPGAAFGLPTPIATAGSAVALAPGLALADSGAAVVVWTSLFQGATTVRMRDRPGAFGAPRVLSEPVGATKRTRTIADVSRLILQMFGGGADVLIGPRALFAGDGRALVTWQGPVLRHRPQRYAGHAIFLDATGAGEPQALGSELRDPTALTPVLLEGGIPAAAWADGNRVTEQARLHVANESVTPASDPAPPRVRVGKARLIENALVVPITCSAACDVRADVGTGVDSASDVMTLERGGTEPLALTSFTGALAPRRTGPVRIHLRYGAAGAVRGVERTVTVKLQGAPRERAPRIVDLTARRSGGTIVVRWRTPEPTMLADAFILVGLDAGGDLAADDLGRYDDKPHRQFVRRLKDPDKRVRSVRVISSGPSDLYGRIANARVR